MLLALVASLAVTLAVEEHHDHVLSEEILWASSELQDTVIRITNIKGAEMKDMNDYIRTYPQLSPLLNDCDRLLDRISNLYSQARKREASLLAVVRVYRRPIVTNPKAMAEILDMARSLTRIMKQEVSTIQNMAALPESERLQFWHEQFLPLEAEERSARVRLAIVTQRMLPGAH
jgi:hypothetical protein